MALIKCKECGHEVSDKASACPNCGCPIEKVPVCGECGQQIPDGVEACPNCGCPIERKKTVYQEEVEKHKKKNGWIWALAIMLLCLIGGGGYYFYNQSKGDNAEDEKDTSQNDNNCVIADGDYCYKGEEIANGDYCYKGEWESSRYAAQPCKVEFTKRDSSLLNCSYTNLKYNSRIPLKGTIHGNELHFVGDINGKQLVIDLKVSSDGNSLIGEGVDHSHSDKAKLNLTKGMVDNEYAYQQDEHKEEAMYDAEGPDWLQGAWRLELTDDYGNRLGYMYEVFNHGKSKSYIDGRLVSERDYTVSDNIIMYDKGHYQLDNNRQIVLGANGQKMQKVSSDPYYTPNSSSSQSSSSSSDKSSSYRFSSPQDVIGWLADKSFHNGSRMLRIRPDGVWLNDYCATFAPNVERWESWKALVRASTATGQRLSFLIDPIHGQVTDEAGDVFSLR